MSETRICRKLDKAGQKRSKPYMDCAGVALVLVFSHVFEATVGAFQKAVIVAVYV